MMYTRTLTHTIIQNLDLTPAVALLGPRQVGKTTLALSIAQSYPSVYLDLENPQDLIKLKNPVEYLQLHEKRLVILDEVQTSPHLFKTLRGVIDAGRRRGIRKGRFLLLGSASRALLQQSSESLAGRIHYCELSGLNPLEIEQPHGLPLQTLWLRGGFPESYRARDDEASGRLRTNLIRTYLERDIPQLGPRIPANTLMRFWTMLAHSQGEIWNASKIAGSLGIASVTASRYLDLMTDLMLVHRLQPWSSNMKKRLVKSPRVYVRDSGLVHALLQIAHYEALLSHPVLGKSWEGFVIEHIVSSLPFGTHAYFYRTASGAEIDLVLERGPNILWALDIKASHTPKVQRGFHISCQDLQVTRKFAIYPGNETFPLGHNITAISLAAFMTLLHESHTSP